MHIFCSENARHGKERGWVSAEGRTLEIREIHVDGMQVSGKEWP